jgi:4-carboxymuconolactone decarboxylase
MAEEKRELAAGEKVAMEIWGEGYGEILRAIINAYDPAFTESIVSFFGHTYARPSLDVKTRQICTLSALAALGLAPEMVIHFRGSLNLGWTQRELRDALMLTIFTGGIPKTINAFKVFHDVLAELKIPPETATLPSDWETRDAAKDGEEKGRALFGDAWDAFLASLRRFDEGAAAHLVADVFGRIFTRPALDDRVRALIIVAALSALGNTRLLKAFLPAAVRAGAREGEIAEIIYQMHGYAGWQAVVASMEVFREVFP